MEAAMSNEVSDMHAEFVYPITKFNESCEKWEIPLCANSWILEPCDEEEGIITEDGLRNWSESNITIRVFFHVKQTVKLDLALRCKVPEGESKIEVKVLDVPQIIEVTEPEDHTVPIGKYRIFGTGYVKVDLKGIERTGEYFADVSHLIIPKYNLEEDTIYYIKVDDISDTYWHRRGPSLHLFYKVPEGCGDQEYYYNEVTVPAGYDQVGSYFMAIGFADGYFGIQVNSTDERRVLFSVWSPQETDDPEGITEDNAVLLINKGEEVNVEAFGGEGSGGKSYLLYNWLPDTPYKFLVRGRPDPMIDNCTLYSAWFEEKKSPNWKLIAEFCRPKTCEYLTRFHSFIENFDEGESNTCRIAYFNNQWIRDTSGNWHEVTGAKVTGDATATQKVRLDFEGGVMKTEDRCDGFYLKHCGFFVGACNLSSQLRRPALSEAPCMEYTHKNNQQEFQSNIKVELIDSDANSGSDSEMLEIPLHSNAWLINDPDTPGVITEYGLGNWVSLETEVHIFLFLKQSVKFNLFLRCKVPDGKSSISVDVCGITRVIEVQGASHHDVFVGRYRFLGRDYVRIVLKGVSHEGNYIADVSHVLIPKDELSENSIKYIEDNSNSSDARRGPVVLLNYIIPLGTTPDEFYYAEVLLSKRHIHCGSKVIAIGFDKGYLGIQDGDKIIFSMTLPESDAKPQFQNRVSLLLEADDVVTDFGSKNGSMALESLAKTSSWQGGVNEFKFLLRGRPDTERPGYTVYTAWFNQAPDNQWRFISSLSTSSIHLTGFHSSIENLDPETSYLMTRATFRNQLVRRANGYTFQVTKAEAMVTNAHGRVDYDAVVVDTDDDCEGFSLSTCGFLKGNAINGMEISRMESRDVPHIKFEEFM